MNVSTKSFYVCVVLFSTVGAGVYRLPVPLYPMDVQLNNHG